MARLKEAPVQVGIAGLGRSGWNIHSRLLALLPDKYKVTAVFDENAKRLQEAKTKFGCKTHSDFGSFLNDSNIELVTVAMPSHLHASCSIQSLKAGKHTVCEKPMATCLKDADKMIAAAKKAGKILTIFQNARYKPAFMKVKELIQSGKLGRIILIRITEHGFSRRWDWQTLQKFGGGTLNNTCPHLIDQALQLFGEEEPKIFAHLEKALTLGDAEDHVKITLKGRIAPTIDIEVTSTCAYPQPSWFVMGTRGGLTVEGDILKWKYLNPRRKLPRRKVDTRPTPDRSYNGEKYDWKEERLDLSKSSKNFQERPGETDFYLDLYETLRNKVPLAITPQSVRRQIAIIEKIHKESPIWNHRKGVVS